MSIMMCYCGCYEKKAVIVYTTVHTECICYTERKTDRKTDTERNVHTLLANLFCGIPARVFTQKYTNTPARK